MIDKFKISGGQNDYATIIDPTDHEDERQQLVSEGYMPYSRYKIQDKDNINFDKTEELWVK